MRLFGKTRSSKAPTVPSVEPYHASAEAASKVFENPRDKYGMVDPDEEEIPTPAFPGMEAPTDFQSGSNEVLAPNGVPTPRRNSGRVTKEDTQVSNDKKKNKKKKRKKRTKKKNNATTEEEEEEEEEDLPIVVDRTPTAMEYESDDSIEKMIDEKSRYSRYTTEHDEINVEKFDEGLEIGNDVKDKYAGNGASYPIATILSDESNPAKWHSDEEEEKHSSRNMRSPEKRNTTAQADLGFESPTRNGGRKKKYQDLQAFQKKRSSSRKISSDLEQKNNFSFQVPDIGTLLSPTKQPGAPETLPRNASDTSSLTDPLHKLEKYTTQLAKQRSGAKSRGRGMPNEMLEAQSSKQRSQMIIPVALSGSSDNLHHSYKVEDGIVSPTAEEKLVELDQHMARIGASESGSISFLGEQEMMRDRYAELEVASTASINRKKKSISSSGKKDTMYTNSLMMEEESMYSNNSPRPLGRVERTRRGQMKELDEYSLTMSVQDTPALVQCLKFYHCGAAAAFAGVATGGWFSSKNNVAKEVELLGRGPELSEVDKLRYRENEDDIPSSMPVVRGRSASSRVSKSRSAGMKQTAKFEFEQQYEMKSMMEEEEEEDSQFDEATIDAPDVAAVDPGSSRYLREVTELSLRLDDGDDQQSRSTPERGRKMTHESDNDDIEIREISIPRSSSLSSKKSRKKPKQRKDQGVLHETQNQSDQRAILDAQNTIRDVKDSKRDEIAGPQQLSDAKPRNMEIDENVDSPEVNIVNKKSIGGNSEKSKKGLSGVFARFGRRGKKANDV